MLENWRECKLGDITSILGDGLHGTPNYDKNGEYFFINGNNLSNGKIVIKSDTKRADLSEYKKYNKNLNDRTILVSINGTLGNIALYNNEKCILGKSACYFNVNDDIDKYFIKYIVTNKDFQEYIRNFATGTTIPNVSLKTMREYKFFLPPLQEQKAIAEILSSLDDKIDLLHRQNHTLESIAQTLFRQWFIQDAQPDWEEKPLSKIADFLNGLACQKFPPKNDIDKLPVLKIKDLKDGISESSDYADSNIKPEYIVNSGDVIFAWSASLMVKIWYGKKCILNQHLFKVTSKHFPKWFYYHWCKYHLDNFIAISSAHATTMGHIKRGDLDEAMCLVPSNSELSKMNNQISHIFEKIQLNSKQIQTLENLRDTLLPKLISGEVRIKI